MKYSEYETALERFSIMTVDGGIKDVVALQFIEKAYGSEIRGMIEQDARRNKEWTTNIVP